MYSTCTSLSVDYQVAQKLGQIPCTIVQGILTKISKREFSVFIFFSNTYTCFYVV